MCNISQRFLASNLAIDRLTVANSLSVANTKSGEHQEHDRNHDHDHRPIC